MTDIVTTLRTFARNWHLLPSGPTGWLQFPEHYNAAADEIERLRALLNEHPHAEHDRRFFCAVQDVLDELDPGWMDDEDVSNHTLVQESIRRLAAGPQPATGDVERAREIVKRLFGREAEPREETVIGLALAATRAEAVKEFVTCGLATPDGKPAFKLPRTADDKPVVPEMELFYPEEWSNSIEEMKSCWRWEKRYHTRSDGPMPAYARECDCYSTREGAEAALAAQRTAKEGE